LVLCISLYIFVSCLVLLYIFLCFCFLCFFVLGCGSSTTNEDIVRFRCGRESHTLFTHNFVKFFHKFLNFCMVFFILGLFVPFFIDF